jgi:hypothetical protein
MNFQEPLKFNSIDFTKLVYPKQKSGQNKKIIVIKLEEKNKLKNFVVQTPSLLVLNKPQLNSGYADLELGLVGKEESKVRKFVKFLNDLEMAIKTDAQYNASSWFNITEENQSINFQKIIRESEKCEKGYVKFKILKNNDFETVLQMNNNKRIHINDLSKPDFKDMWCKMILEVYAVWVNNMNEFGVFFRPILVSFTPREVNNYNYKFAEESDEDVADIPDTEIANNIFMKIDDRDNNKEHLNSNANTTTQLDINELVESLNGTNTGSGSELCSIKLNLDKMEQSPEQSSEESSEHSSHHNNEIKLGLNKKDMESSSEIESSDSHVSFSDSDEMSSDK